MNSELYDAITTYQAPAHAHQVAAEHPSMNIAGPTGAGKGTLATYLTQSGNYAPVVSDTTRAPRPHNDGFEVNGVNYWFLTEEEALAKVNEGAYIEVKAVHRKTMYGTSVAAYEKVIASGQTPLLEIDVQGMEELMARYESFSAVFLLPPDFAIWQSRLDGRGHMPLDERIERFKSAQEEIAVLLRNPRFYPVINHEVIETAKLISSGDYKDADYREKAITLAAELQSQISSFLASHPTQS